MPADYVDAQEFWNRVRYGTSDAAFLPPEAFVIPKPPLGPVIMPGDRGVEVRMVSSTGAEKGAKLARYDLIPAEPLKLLAEHFGRGALKYADNNWRKGYDWSLSFAAMQRHAWAFWGGEDIDEETGTPHIICAAWHCFAMAHYLSDPKKYGEFDNRAK